MKLHGYRNINIQYAALISHYLFIFSLIPCSSDVLKPTWSWPNVHRRKCLDKERQSQGLDLLPEMQFDLNGSLGSAAVLRGLKDTGEYVCHARTGLLPSIAGVKSHHGVRNQVNGLRLVGKALIEQFTFLEVKSKGESRQDVERFHFTKVCTFKIKEQNHKYA